MGTEMLRSACNETGSARRFIGWHTIGPRAQPMSTNHENDHETAARSLPARPGCPPCPGGGLTVRFTVRRAGGPAGRTRAAAQGRALADLLAVLAEAEVGQDREASR
jgi:hypothetical protein